MVRLKSFLTWDIKKSLLGNTKIQEQNLWILWERGLTVCPIPVIFSPKLTMQWSTWSQKQSRNAYHFSLSSFSLLQQWTYFLQIPRIKQKQDKMIHQQHRIPYLHRDDSPWLQHNADTWDQEFLDALHSTGTRRKTKICDKTANLSLTKHTGNPDPYIGSFLHLPSRCFRQQYHEKEPNNTDFAEKEASDKQLRENCLYTYYPYSGHQTKQSKRLSENLACQISDTFHWLSQMTPQDSYSSS